MALSHYHKVLGSNSAPAYGTRVDGEGTNESINLGYKCTVCIKTSQLGSITYT